MPGRKADVAIVGGGLAGIAAADRLSRGGARVVLIDDNAQPGGQYLRGGRAAGGRDNLRRRGLEAIDRLEAAGVEIRSGAELLGIEPGFELLVARGGELSEVRCERLLLATGARERFMPFPGWTLPGVTSTGAAQILIKQSGVLPARRTLVGGAGLFLNAVAGDIVKNGGRVSSVADEAPRHTLVPRPGLIPGAWRKFVEGGAAMARLLAARTPLLARTRIVAAHGDGDGLREVVTARVDGRGAVVAGSERVHATDSLTVGFGFIANVEVALLAGCEVVHNEGLGGWVVRVDAELETTVPGVYAAGEITAVGGAAKSWTEGRLAADAILRRAGFLKPGELQAETTALRHRRNGQMAFARYFNSRHTFGAEYMARWVRGLADEVPLCRCESVTLGAVRRAVAEGFATPAGIKKATRCGMGICQGSTCRTILAEVLAALTGRSVAQLPLPSVRMPLKPVSLGTLAGSGH